jgi:hypothetical protein
MALVAVCGFCALSPAQAVSANKIAIRARAQMNV